MYERTLEVAGRQVPYFRTPEFSQVVLESEQLLKRFAGADADARVLLLTASGTAGMESVVMNCFDQTDRLLVVDGGTFGHRFVELCQWHEIPNDVVRLEYGESLTEAHLHEQLRQDTTGLLINMHETSTGQLYDMEMVSAFAAAHELYLVVDGISSFLADPFSMSSWGVDALILSSQKALSLAPGLSPVVLSSRLIEHRVLGRKSKTMYFDFKDALANGQRGQTPFTPAVGIVLELHDMLQHIEATGLDAVIGHTADLASDFRAKATAIGLGLPDYPLSNALTPIYFPRGNAMEAFELLIEEHETYLNPTGGALSDNVLRVGHIGNHSKEGNDKIVEALKLQI